MRYLIATLTGVAIAMSASAGYAESVADKRGLTLEGARQVIAATVDAARKADAPGGSIAVVDEGGNLLALERLDHTFAASANIAIGKARTAALFKKSTKVFEDAIKNGRTSMVTLGGDLQNFTPLQGGIPLEWEGKVVGAIGVSGAAQDPRCHHCGSSCVAYHAGDMINEFSVLMKAGAGAKTIAGTIHPYPTQAEVNKKVVNLWRKAHFTNGQKNILTKWFAWTRKR